MRFSPLILLFLSSALIFVSNGEEKFKFTNYKLVRLFPTTKEQIVFINQLEEKDNKVIDINISLILFPLVGYIYDEKYFKKVDIMGSVLVGNEKSIDILLPPEKFAQYVSVFEGRAIKYQVVHQNIQE